MAVLIISATGDSEDHFDIPLDFDKSDLCVAVTGVAKDEYDYQSCKLSSPECV